MSSLLQDVRYALRTLGRSPGFTAVALLTLALGIGANTTIFSIMNAVLYRPLPFANPSRLATIVKHFKPTDAGQIYIDPPGFADWTADTSVFQAAALIASGSANLSTADRPEHLSGSQISAGTFDLLGVRPALGRSFLADEATPGRDRVVILSDVLWRQRFAADVHILGRQVLMDGVPHTVVGVMPPGFAFPEQARFWRPLVFDPTVGRGDNWVNAVVRLREGVTVARADAYLSTVSRRLEQEYPASNTGVSASLAPVRRMLLGGADPDDYRVILFLMLGAVGFVLLIACANLAGLLLTRASTRQHEIAIREALGASRRRLIQQLLTESGLVAVGGGALGVLIAMWALDLFRGAIPRSFEIPYWLGFALDWRGVLFTVLLSLATGLAVGVLPALRTTRCDLRGALQEGSRGSGVGARASRLRSSFVIGEVALAMVLLVGAGLLIRTVIGLGKVDPGFDAVHAFTARVPFGGARYGSARARGAFLNELARRVEALPGVEALGAFNLLPLGTTNWEAVRIEGEDDSSHTTLVTTTTGHALRALGIPLREGREFTETETEHGALVATVNETMARRYWPDQSPLGKRIRFGRDWSWRTIVGVLHDAKQGRLHAAVRDQVYIPYGRQYSWSTMSVTVRTRGDPMQAVGMVRAELARLDPTIPVYDVVPMQDVVRRSYWDRRLYGAMFSIFAGVALFLAAIGIYGVMAQAVAQRTHEIGVRIALGAEPRDVLALVVRQGVGLALAGVVVGALAAVALTRALASLLFGVSPLDPVSFAGTGLLLACVAAVASYLPAHRAARVDPVVALRYE